MTMEEVCLPRGGVPRSTAPAQKPAPKDVLFGASTSSSQKKRRRKHRAKPKGSADDAPEEELPSLEPLNAHSLTEGVVLLGCVQLVHDFGLKVSLPYGSVGNVGLSDISRVYSNLLRRFAHGEQDVDDTAIARVNALFRERQCVVCKVLSVSPERAGAARVALTLDPARVNADLLPSAVCPGMVLQAAVASIEDYGYTMDCGVANLEGFLSQAEARDYLRKCNQGQPLAVGQLLSCVVLSVEARALQLSIRPKLLESPQELKEGNLSCMLPGMKAKLTVTQVQDDGLCVLWQNFEGCVYKSHLIGTWDLPRHYSCGQEVTGTLLYIDPGSRHPYWSLKALGRWEPPRELSIGALVEDARVVGVDSWGAHLELTRGKLRAYVPRAHVAEGEVDDARDVLMPSQICRCRIMAFNMVDCVAVVSLKKSSLEGMHLTPDMLNLGMKLVGKVHRVLPSGTVVCLGPWMRGFVSVLHLGGRTLQVGQPVRCHLLQVEAHCDPPRLWFTCHRGLMTSRRPPLTKYTEAVPGRICDGLVAHVIPQGILVVFYGNVRGWVPPREMLRCPVPLVERYKIGQLVTCRVVLCELEKERLTLSLKLKAKDEDKEAQDEVSVVDRAKPGVLEAGMILSGKVLAKHPSHLVVELSDGASAVLPKDHLSDFTAHCQQLWESLAIGDPLETLLCFGTQEQIVVSRRASFIHLARNELLITRLEDFEVGFLAYGLVSAFNKGGMLVDLPGNIVGFVPLSKMRNFYVADATNSGFVLGQLVVAQFFQLDGLQPILSTKPGDVVAASDITLLHQMVAWLQDENLLQELHVKRSQSESRSLVTPCSLVEVCIRNVKQDTVNCEVSGFPAKAWTRHLKKFGKEIPQQTEGIVVAVRWDAKDLEVCIDPAVVNKHKAAKKEKLKTHQQYRCMVVSVKEDYALVQLPLGHLCIVPTSHCLNPLGRLDLQEDTSGTVWVWKLYNQIAIGSYVPSKDKAASRKRKTVVEALPAEPVDAEHSVEERRKEVNDLRQGKKGAKRKKTTAEHRGEQPEAENSEEEMAVPLEEDKVQLDAKAGKKKRKQRKKKKAEQQEEVEDEETLLKVETGEKAKQKEKAEQGEEEEAQQREKEADQKRRGKKGLNTPEEQEAELKRKGKASLGENVAKKKVKGQDDKSNEACDLGIVDKPFESSDVGEVSDADVDEADAYSIIADVGSDLASDTDDDSDIGWDNTIDADAVEVNDVGTDEASDAEPEEWGAADVDSDGPAPRADFLGRRKGFKGLEASSELVDVPVEADPEEETLEPSSLKPGGECRATVTAVDKFQLKVKLPGNLPSRVHVTLVEDSPSEGTMPLKQFKVGDKVTVYMTKLKAQRGQHNMPITGREARVPYECSLFKTSGALDLEPGRKVTGIYSHLADGCLHLLISPKKAATLPVLNLKVPVEKLPYIPHYFKTGQAVNGTVFRVYEDGLVELSQLGVGALQVGQVVNARVLSVRATIGAFLCLPLGCRGIARMTDFCDDFSTTQSFISSISEMRYTTCCIVSIEADTGVCHVSMRASRLGSTAPVTDREVSTLRDLQVGDHVRGFVQSVNKRGCFVTIGCNISGLVPRSALPPYLLNNRALKSDSLVTVEVRCVDCTLGLVMLALLETHETPHKRERKASEAADTDSPSLKQRSSETEIWCEGSQHGTAKQDLPRLNLSEDFSWEVTARPDLSSLAMQKHEMEEEDSDAEEEKPARKKSRKEILEERQRKEAELCEKERALMDPSREPETVDDFDRLVLASPNSSMVWLRYMAFHLQQAEVEKARAVGHRALSVISFREEQEKLNVWTALLNLENLYGTQESLQGIFNEALRYNEPLKVYTHLAQIYIASEKHEQAEQLYKQMLTKFKQSTDLWLSCGLFYMKNGRAEEARAVMERALRSLPKQEHVGLLSKFAQMEFKYGSVERGKSMFDSILVNCPKRTDLWLVCIDQHVKQGDINGVRTLFIKATSSRFHPKKMKVFFKKWLDFEKEHGDSNSVQEVRDRAVKYVEAHAADIG